MYKSKLSIAKGVAFTLSDYYSIYTPGPCTIEQRITPDSIRDLLILVSLLTDSSIPFGLVFERVETISEVEPQGTPPLCDDVGGRTQYLEHFIRDRWGFFTPEMLLDDWVDHIRFVLNEEGRPLVT